MTEIEKITTLIGETLSTEMEGVNRVDYNVKEKSSLTAFVVIMENGKRYNVSITE